MNELMLSEQEDKQDDFAIIAAVQVCIASPKSELRWKEKDQYKQILLDEMHLFDNNEVQVEKLNFESQRKTPFTSLTLMMKP